MDRDLIEAVENINESDAECVVKALVKQKVAPREIANDLNDALQRVARRYENGEYYIADLIMAGELVTSLLRICGLESEDGRGIKGGKIAVGTVFDDIHDVGKNIFVSMLRSEGFEVIDLGIDVPPERFVEVIREEKPDIIGISGILTSVVDNIKMVVEAIEEAGLRSQVRIILGGVVAGNNYAKYVGADGFSSDAIEGVGICKKWLA